MGNHESMDAMIGTQTRHSAAAASAKRDEPFGTVLGVAPGGVPAYSSDYATWNVPRGKRDWRNMHETADGQHVYTGAKWQCVEFARRWLLVNRGYTFSDIPMAYHIMELDHVTVQTGQQRGATKPLWACTNGGLVRPQVGNMLIWDRSYDGTGHVAIVTEVGADYVRIAEQNFEDWKWEARADYARELRATTGNDGSYTVHDAYQILGWMAQEDANPNSRL